MGTKIEWAEETWNPIIGCSKVSPGCQNCYAERMAGRLANMGQKSYKDIVLFEGSGDDDNPKTNFIGFWNGTTKFVESALEKPLHWKKPRTIFVCSMGDLFHETASFNDILEVMHVIDKCPQHTFLILTKRPQHMHEFFTDWVPNPFWINGDYLPNVWLGVTTENQEMADERIPILLDIPAAKRFVSIEPMLGPIKLNDIDAEIAGHKEYIHINSLTGKHTDMGRPCNPVNKLDWVICGGESGPGARPMHPDWVRSLRDQCVAAEAPFMMKQWGEWAPIHDLRCNEKGINGKVWYTFDPDTSVCKIGKKKAGRELDGKVWNQKPEQ